MEEHIETIKAQRDEALEDKKKADIRSSDLEAEIKAVRQELSQAQLELSQEKSAHAADKSAAEIAKAQAESEDLLFDSLDGDLMVISHADIFLDTVILIRGNVNLFLSVICHTLCDILGIAFVSLVTLIIQIGHCCRRKYNTIYIMR